MAWTEPSTSPACPALAMATPGLAQPLGREAWESWPLTQPHQPSPPLRQATHGDQERVPEAMLTEGSSQWWAGVDGSRSSVGQWRGTPGRVSRGRFVSGHTRVGSHARWAHLPLHTAGLTQDLRAPWSDTMPTAGVPQWSVRPLAWGRLCPSLGKQACGFLEEQALGR